MKILFIDPHLSSKNSAPSLNLMNIITVCEYANHETKKIGFEIDDRHFEKLNNFYDFEKGFCEQIGQQSKDYDVIAVTTTFSVIKRTKMILDAARKYNPSIKTIIGGGFTHYLLMCEEWLADLYSECLSLDYAVVGEGEDTIIELLNKIADPCKVKGVIYRNGSIKFTGVRNLITNLDALPINDYAKYATSKYSHIRLLAARGCPHSCSFCEVCLQWGGEYRIRSARSVAKEIEHIQKTINISKIRFADSTFTLHPMLKQICEEITPLKTEWVAYARVNDITDEKLSYMKKSGCKGLYFGIESASDKTLRSINKKITSHEIKNIVHKVQSYGIKVSGTMILGFPHETLDDIRQTISFVKELNLDGYSWHRYMLPVELIARNPKHIKRFNWSTFETDIPYELIPELARLHPEVTEDMHVPIILAELKERNVPNVPINRHISLPEYTKLLIKELDGFMSECAQQDEIRVMNSTVERMLN